MDTAGESVFFLPGARCGVTAGETARFGVFSERTKGDVSSEPEILG